MLVDLILPFDGSAAGKSAITAANRALTFWAKSLLILIPSGHEVMLAPEFPAGAQVLVETLTLDDPDLAVERVRQEPWPATLVLCYEALSQPGWLGDVTRRLLHRPPAALLVARPEDVSSLTTGIGTRSPEVASARPTVVAGGSGRARPDLLCRRRGTISSSPPWPGVAQPARDLHDPGGKRWLR